MPIRQVEHTRHEDRIAAEGAHQVRDRIVAGVVQRDDRDCICRRVVFIDLGRLVKGAESAAGSGNALTVCHVGADGKEDVAVGHHRARRVGSGFAVGNDRARHPGAGGVAGQSRRRIEGGKTTGTDLKHAAIGQQERRAHLLNNARSAGRSQRHRHGSGGDPLVLCPGAAVRGAGADCARRTIQREGIGAGHRNLKYAVGSCESSDTGYGHGRVRRQARRQRVCGGDGNGGARGADRRRDRARGADHEAAPVWGAAALETSPPPTPNRAKP